MTLTPAEEMVALMRSLTLSQRIALVKTAREYAKQNRSKPQKSDAKVFVGKAAAARMRPKDGVASITPATSAPPPQYAACNKCGYEFLWGRLQKHQKKCTRAPKPPMAPIGPKSEVTYEWPPPSGRFVKNRDNDWDGAGWRDVSGGLCNGK